LREYEVMLILPAEADESVVGGAVERITKILSERGGEVRNIDRWGRRRFAYPIARQSEGYYVVVRFTSEPDAISEIDRSLTLADEVLRFKVVVREDDTEAAISRRLEVYEEQTAPLVAWYLSSDRLAAVDGTGTPDVVTKRLLRAIENRLR